MCLLLPFVFPALLLSISSVVSGHVSVVPRVTFLYKEIESAFDNESNKMIEKKPAPVVFLGRGERGVRWPKWRPD